MAKATRNLKITLELSEQEARDIYVHLNPKPGFEPNSCNNIKQAIKEVLGYEPKG
jgi:hypothetical protein